MTNKYNINQEVVIMDIQCTVTETIANPRVGYTYHVYHLMNGFYNDIEWQESDLISVSKWEQQRWDKREALNQSIKQKLAKLDWKRS